MPAYAPRNWGKTPLVDSLAQVLQFGAVLYEVRTRAQCTQTQVANQVGVSKTYVSAIENSRYAPPGECLINAIADTLGASQEERTTLLEVAAMERLLLALPSSLSPNLTNEVHHAVIRESKKLESTRKSTLGEKTM